MKSVARGFLESSACLRAPFIPTRCAIGPGSPRGLPLPPAGPNSHPSPGTGSRIPSASLTAQARAGAGSLRGHTRSCSAPPAPADRAADRWAAGPIRWLQSGAEVTPSRPRSSEPSNPHRSSARRPSRGRREGRSPPHLKEQISCACPRLSNRHGDARHRSSSEVKVFLKHIVHLPSPYTYATLLTSAFARGACCLCDVLTSLKRFKFKTKEIPVVLFTRRKPAVSWLWRVTWWWRNVQVNAFKLLDLFTWMIEHASKQSNPKLHLLVHCALCCSPSVLTASFISDHPTKHSRSPQSGLKRMFIQNKNKNNTFICEL